MSISIHMHCFSALLTIRSSSTSFSKAGQRSRAGNSKSLRSPTITPVWPDPANFLISVFKSSLKNCSHEVVFTGVYALTIVIWLDVGSSARRRSSSSNWTVTILDSMVKLRIVILRRKMTILDRSLRKAA